MTLFSAGRQTVTGCRIEDPADFCRKMAADFGAEVYRNSTGDLGLGKSAGKRTRPRTRRYSPLPTPSTCDQGSSAGARAEG